MYLGARYLKQIYIWENLFMGRRAIQKESYLRGELLKGEKSYEKYYLRESYLGVSFLEQFIGEELLRGKSHLRVRYLGVRYLGVRQLGVRSLGKDIYGKVIQTEAVYGNNFLLAELLSVTVNKKGELYLGELFREEIIRGRVF